MRIWHVITLAEFGGAQKVVENLARGQAQQGMEVVVSAFAEGELWQWLACTPSIERRPIKTFVRQISPLKDLLTLIKLFHFFHSYHPDIVHCHSSKAGLLSRIAARLAGVPVIVFTVHGWSFYAPQNQLLRKFYIWLEKMAARCGDALAFVSEADAAAARQEGIASCLNLTIHNGLPLRPLLDKQAARKQLGLPLDKAIIGTVGRLSDQKNPLYVLEVLAQLKEEQDYLFYWIGDGPLAEAARQKAADLGLNDYCHFIGYREDPTLWLAAMDIFLLLSRFEGLPLVIIEAMQQGVPVIAHAVGGTGELVRDGVNGYLIPAGDQRTVLTRIRELLAEPEKALALGRRGRELAERHFTVERMLEQYLALYHKILKLKGREA